MAANILMVLSLLFFARFAFGFQVIQPANLRKVYVDKDDGKSSLVFVFDTTWSMYNDLRQLREGAEMILKTALEESNIIADFVFVPFNDPAVGPATVTKDKWVFKAALNLVKVYGGGDCPEKSLGGIQMALNVSRPKSFVYVFTDATASDHKLVGTILDMVQQKQSQVVFVLTGHCNDLRKPSYKVYQQIAAASSGQVFNLNKTNVHSVLDFVRSSIKGRTVNLASAVRPAGYNYTQGIKVDKTIGEVTVSVSGAKPQIEVVDPSGEKLWGPPKLVTTLDLSEIMIVKVIDPQPGNWSITVGSEKDYSVKVVGLSDLTFNHGFSVEKPSTMAETSYRPLQGTYNNLLIALSKTDVPVKIDFAEILSLDGKTIFEVSLNEVDSKNKVYLANAFVPPEEFFYIAITGHDEHGQEFRRIGSTAVQAKPPDAPYLVAPQKIQARNHERIVLSCSVESLVPVTAMWTKDSLNIQEQINSLQSTTVEYVIEDMAESHAGTYRCVARNVAGVSKAITTVELAVEPPQITILPQNTTVAADENITITCTVLSESPIFNTQIIFSSSERQNHTKFYLEPTPNGIYSFNNTIQRVSDKDGGEYTCVAANRGGQTNQSTFITIQAQPTVQILGPHTLTKLKNTDVQFVCHVEHSSKVQWVGPDDVILQESDVNESYNSVLDVTNITFDGTWTCVALRDSYRATDSIQVSVLMKPRVCIDGERNITILNGTSHQVSCTVVAKPPPRILWHRETEEFLNHTVTVHENNTYISVLTLDSAKEQVNGTYFCFGENSEGIDQDSIIVNVRRKMVLLEGFTDQSVELYSQLGLRCRVNSYPVASVTWLHNGTLITDNMAEDQSLLYIQKVDFDDLGLYTCILDNVYEKMEVNGTLGVSGLESPVLSKETLKKKVKKGEAVILTCRVLKGNPEPTIKWEFRSNASTNFTQLPSNVANSDDGYNIEISNVDIEHAGSYRCTANNVIGQDMYEVELVVQFPPKLSTSKESHLEAPIKVKNGDKKVLSCEADGLPPPIVTWTRNDLPISFSKNIHLTDSNELVIENASEYDSGTYTCKVSNALGTETRNFTLLVFSQPEIVPPTTEDVHVLEGQLVELPCVASGTAPLTLTWFHNGGLIASPKKYIDEYGLRFVANLTDFGDYSCYVQNEYGSSAIFYHLYVWVPPHIDGPLEAEKNVLLGANVTLTCDATAFPVPVISWEFEGQLLKENTSSIQFNDVGNLIIKNATSEQTGVYACVADNMVGVERKFTFLRVDEPPTILSDNFTGPYVATNMDTRLSIPCRAVGAPRPYVVWSKDDQYLDTDPRFQIDLEGTLTIKSPSEELSGEYTCIAKNTVGNVTKTVEVRIYSLFNQMQGEEAKSSVSLVEGTKASVHCPIHSAVDQTVKWYKDAVLISNGTLTFQNVSRQNASTYACVVSNAVASAYASVTVTVQWPPCFTEKVKQDVQVVQGNDWYFDCRVDAKPRAKVKWYFNSKLILGEDKDVLKLLNTHLRHTGTYKCVVNNHHGTVLRQFTLDVLVPPSISEFDLLDVQLKAGTNASLECDAKGSPTPEVTWTFNNTHWAQINSSLVSSLVSTESEGVYRCEARNSAGSRTLVYRVSVVSEAAIKGIVAYTNGEGETVTGNLEVTRGTNVRLACQAYGNPPPTTQWSKHGNVISENEKGISYADLMLKNVDTAQSGVYSCIASNDGGMDERKLKIEVLEPPRIFQELFQNVNSSDNVVNIEVISGQPFYLHCHPSGNPWPEVYWFKDDLPLMFFDESMVTIDFGETVVARKAKYEQSGNYTCVARNKVGNTSVVYLVDVLVAPPQLKDNMKQVDTPANSALNLTCPVEGSPLPYVVWFKHPYQEITDQTPRINLLNDNYTLIINSTEASDSGKYSCIMTNKVGTTEVVFDVTVEQAPSIAGNDGNNTIEKHVVPLRRSVVLKCEVNGHPTPKISWLKDVQQITDNASTHRVLGNSLLTIWSIGARDAGQYICVAQNRAGTAHKRHNVVVQVPGKWSNWSQWSYCNVTCGLGYQSRTRFCHYIDDDNNTIDKSTKSDKIILDESACKGLTVDSRKCFMPSCEQEAGGAGRWTAWSRWSACSAACGAATQTRTRRCRGARCSGDNVQIRKCPNLPRCDYRFENTESNEVLNSRDHRDIQNPYMPEATFEMQPEIVESHRSVDVDNAYVSPAMVPQQLYYDINVTRNLDLSTQGPCKPGYRNNTVQGSCEDIDECAVDTNQCHLTQVCVNTLGGYRCTCSPGYVSLGAGQQCLDINECSLGISGCEVGCVNTAGGYACACPPRLRLHADRHHCVPPSMYREPLSEDLRTEDVLSTSVEFPAKYKKL